MRVCDLFCVSCISVFTPLIVLNVMIADILIDWTVCDVIAIIMCYDLCIVMTKTTALCLLRGNDVCLY